MAKKSDTPTRVELRQIIDEVRGEEGPKLSAQRLVVLLASKVRELSEQLADIRDRETMVAMVEKAADDIEEVAAEAAEAVAANPAGAAGAGGGGAPSAPETVSQPGPPVAGGVGSGSVYESGGGAGANEGQVIWHDARSGDTLATLANSYGASEEEIRTLNPGLAEELLPGQRVRIR
jgi:hypothetical protein